jgi:hypothetical protein
MFGEEEIKKEMGIPEPMVMGAGIRTKIPIKENISNVSGWEKFFLGDPDKKAAKNAKTLADAEFTTALATLAAQMSAEQNNKSSNSGGTTTAIIIGALVLTSVFVAVAVVIHKKNKAAIAAPAIS